MKKTSLLIILLILISGCISRGRAGHQRVPDREYYQPDLEVFIIDDRGGRFAYYPVDRSPMLEKAYIEAHEGEHYSIEVINRSDQRIGVVIAVDGRNIVSGKYSKLRHKEDMYVLEPNELEIFDGWRSARDRVNRFYFTDAGNSYSASFNDYSAMGVIAVAAFQERLPKGYRNSQDVRKRRNYSAGPQSAEESAGTGWGRSEYSPSRKVKFRSEKRPFTTYLIKYEWRQVLCDKGILDCRRSRPYRGNRMWDDDDYAPPPGRGYRKYNERGYDW